MLAAGKVCTVVLRAVSSRNVPRAFRATPNFPLINRSHLHPLSLTHPLAIEQSHRTGPDSGQQINPGLDQHTGSWMVN